MLINNLTKVQEEIVGLLQEEAAEIIQELSKVRRTGTDFCRDGGNTKTIQFVERELTDFYILIALGNAAGLFDLIEAEPEYIQQNKEKLKKWTNIPHSLIESIETRFQ